MRQRLFKVSFSAFLVIMILGCSVKYMAGHAKVASNVSGRELPIYSVDTPEKKAGSPLMPHGAMSLCRSFWTFWKNTRSMRLSLRRGDGWRNTRRM